MEEEEEEALLSLVKTKCGFGCNEAKKTIAMIRNDCVVLMPLTIQ